MPTLAAENRGFLPVTDPLLKVDRSECDGLNFFLENLPYYFGSERMKLFNDMTAGLRFLQLHSLEPEEKIALRRDLFFGLAAHYHSLYDDKEPHVLPEQAARLAWSLAKEARTNPTLSYHLYALNNFWRPDPNEPLTLHWKTSELSAGSFH